ncbi:hypothetical protein GEMRC1_005080 [Eukaryota sp. GEM-RC1]
MSSSPLLVVIRDTSNSPNLSASSPTSVETDDSSQHTFFHAHALHFTTHGEAFVHPFFQLSFLVKVLLMFTFVSIATLIAIFSFSSLSSLKDIIHFLSGSDLEFKHFHVLSMSLCILLFPLVHLSLLSRVYFSVERENSITQGNDLDCLKSLSAIFSYNWKYTATLDVGYFRNKLSNQLKESIEEDQFSSNQGNSDNFPKVSWGAIIVSTLIMLFVMLMGVVGISVVYYDSYYSDNVYSLNISLGFFALPLLACLFNFLGRSVLYYLTSPLSIPERDSIRLWYLVFLRLCFLTVSLLVSLRIYSIASVVLSVSFFFILFFLTFFF